MIQEVLAITQGELQRNRVSLRTEFEKDLPMVTGDRIQLQQVILNLAVNAIEAMRGMSEGLRELCLSSGKVSDIPGEAGTGVIDGDPLTESPGESVLVAIRDTGPGIHTSQLERVCEAYYTTKSQGMGMGLAISRLIIEAHVFYGDYSTIGDASPDVHPAHAPQVFIRLENRRESYPRPLPDSI
jgi:signal transduction histidine kinase